MTTKHLVHIVFKNKSEICEFVNSPDKFMDVALQILTSGVAYWDVVFGNEKRYLVPVDDIHFVYYDSIHIEEPSE